MLTATIKRGNYSTNCGPSKVDSVLRQGQTVVRLEGQLLYTKNSIETKKLHFAIERNKIIRIIRFVANHWTCFVTFNNCKLLKSSAYNAGISNFPELVQCSENSQESIFFMNIHDLDQGVYKQKALLIHRCWACTLQSKNPLETPKVEEKARNFSFNIFIYWSFSI